MGTKAGQCTVQSADITVYSHSYCSFETQIKLKVQRCVCSRMHYGKKVSRWRQCDALVDVILGHFGFWHPCERHFGPNPLRAHPFMAEVQGGNLHNVKQVVFNVEADQCSRKEWDVLYFLR